MALTKDEHELPNLKIEIENDLEEAMDTDDGEVNKLNPLVLHGRSKDVEEGEVCEIKEVMDTEIRTSKVPDALPKTTNVPSRDIRTDGNAEILAVSATFEAKVDENFDEKLKQYGLFPDQVQEITRDKLAALYCSLGMKDDEGTEKRYRLDAIHMRGTQDMSTDDVFDYFKGYSPASIEWINDYSCNVVWISNFLAAKAILEMSRPINGLEINHPKDPFAEDKIPMENRRNRLSSDNVVVMVTEVEDQDNEVLMDGDDETCEEETAKVKDASMDQNKIMALKGSANVMKNDENAAHASEIDIPIPPGLWRLGKPAPKAKHILLRFTMKTDRKPARAEKMSDYYKKHGNPNYGGIKGLITKSRKRRFREKSNLDSKPPKGNPWGSLAETWGNIDRRKAMLPGNFDRDGEIHVPFPTTVRVPGQGQRPVHMMPLISQSAKVHMRQVSEPFFHPMGLTSDPESDKSSDEDESNSDQWRRKIKQPRMRMYADDEEKKVERRREQQRREAEVAAAVRRGADFGKVVRNPLLGGGREDGIRRKQVGDLRSRLGKDRSEAVKRVTPAISVVTRQKRSPSSVWNRLAQRDKAVVDSDDDDDDDEEEDEEVDGSDSRPVKVDLRTSLTKKPFEGDLRSKLNRNKTLKNSPLRIEIDNDEYYRVTGSDQE